MNNRKIIALLLCFAMIFSNFSFVLAEETNSVIDPKVLEVTAESVTLESLNGYEYSNGGELWQSNPVFSGLKPNVKYIFYQRKADIGEGIPSEISNLIEVTTLKYSVDPPEMPTLVSRTDTTVTLKKTTGYQYSNNGSTWSSNNVFKNLEPNTSYYFYQRIAATSTQYASDSSPALLIKTKGAAVNCDDIVIELITDTKIVLKQFEGYEYSIDGETWQNEPTFNDLEPLSKYTLHQRIKETNNSVSGNEKTKTVLTNKASQIPEGYIGIYSKDDLSSIRNNLDGKYILMNDIVFSKSDFSVAGDYYNDGKGWEPIGDKTHEFTGVLNGNGHYVSGIYIDCTLDRGGWCGLISYNTGSIKNIGVINCNINVRAISNKSDVGNNRVGGIVGQNVGSISMSYTSGTISSYTNGTYLGNHAGGITGGGGTITDCYNMADVCITSERNAHISCGGISPGGTVKNCYNIGNVDAKGGYCKVSGTTISSNGTNCYSIDSVSRIQKLSGSLSGNTVYLSNEDMKSKTSFAGFEFGEIWYIDDSYGYPYPQLKSCRHVESNDTTFYAGGSGTIHDPYIIKTKEHLYNIEMNLGANYKLGNNIVFKKDDFKDTYWEPIGGSFGERFFGQFDGAGYVIQGLEINIETDDVVAAGLFGFSSGIIKNIGMIKGDYYVLVNDHEDTNGTNVRSFSSYLGGVAGYNCGIISHCYNTNKIKINNDVKNIYNVHAGGICGVAGYVENCYNAGTVIASGSSCDAGGVVGYQGKIYTCYNIGKVVQIDNSTATASGICSYPTKIVNSYTIPVVEGYTYEDDSIFASEEDMMKQDTFVGFDFETAWIVSGNYPYPQLRSVKHIDTLSSNEAFAEGKGTKNAPYIVRNLEQLKYIEKESYAHYKLGNNIDLSNIAWTPICQSRDNPFTGTIDGNGYSIKGMEIAVNEVSGENIGFIGCNAGVIKNICFESPTLDVSYSGADKLNCGIVCGYNDTNSQILNCKIVNGYINVSSKDGEMSVGGISGINDSRIIKSAYEGDINANFLESANAHLGGITGYNDRYGLIEKTYVNADIIGEHYLSNKKALHWGGLAGYAEGTINNSFYTGNIYVVGDKRTVANSYVGGIAASITSDTVMECIYQYANIITSNNRGVSNVNASGSSRNTKNVYYNSANNLSGSTGVGLTGVEMCVASSFLGFDFNDVWVIDAGNTSEYQYPKLKDVEFYDKLKFKHITSCKFSSIPDQQETGGEIKPAIEVEYHGKKLVFDKDYYLTYKNNISPGVATVTVVGVGDYIGEKSISFRIIPKKEYIDISECSIMLESNEYIYNGRAIEPEVISNGLQNKTDYVLSYSDNVDAGIGYVYVLGEGKYIGKQVLPFTIKKLDISNIDINENINEKYQYTGKPITPKIVISGLIENVDYIVKYDNNTRLGTATVTVEGINNCSGVTITQFNIVVPDLKAPKSISVELYGHDDVNVKWDKVKGATGYYVYYKKSTASKYTLYKTTKKTSCVVGNLIDGTKYYFRIYPYIEADSVKYKDSSYKTSNSIYTLKKITKPKVKKVSKSYIRISWSNINGETGYQIAKSKYKSKKFSIVKTVGYKYSNAKIKTTKNKKYYYRIRAYKTISGKKVYGPWSYAKAYTLR